MTMISEQTHDGLEVDVHAEPNGAALRRAAHTAWTKGLPLLHGRRLALRDLHATDAPALRDLSEDGGTRFMSPDLTTVDAMEDFIVRAQKQRSEGRYACLAVVPDEQDTAVGMFQLRLLDDDMQKAEWNLVLGSAYWGRGLYLEARANAAVRL